MRLAEFDYALPEELIAQHPAVTRAGSRLLRLDAASGRIEAQQAARCALGRRVLGDQLLGQRIIELREAHVAAL